VAGHRNMIGTMMVHDPRLAARRLRELMRNANGNSLLVSNTLGVSRRQFYRWCDKLREYGIMDMREYRRQIRAVATGYIYIDASGRRMEE